MQGYAGIGRHQDFVIHAAGLGISAGEKVRLDLHAVSRLVVVHFHLVRIHHGVDEHEVAGGGFDRNRAVGVVHRDPGPGPDVEAILLVVLRDECSRQHRAGGHADDRQSDCAPAHVIPQVSKITAEDGP